jgi:hypothetical protein
MAMEVFGVDEGRVGLSSWGLIRKEEWLDEFLENY